MYYRNANCAVVVYDITQSASLEKARSWIRELQRQADPSIVIALCGNKTDLDARRQVTQEEAKKYADEEGLMWGETSAKSGEGVSEIFTEIGAFLLASYERNHTYLLYRNSQEAPEECASVSESTRRSDRCCPGWRRSHQAGERHWRAERAMQLLSSATPLRFPSFCSSPVHIQHCSSSFRFTCFPPVLIMFSMWTRPFTMIYYFDLTCSECYLLVRLSFIIQGRAESVSLQLQFKLRYHTL